MSRQSTWQTCVPNQSRKILKRFLILITSITRDDNVCLIKNLEFSVVIRQTAVRRICHRRRRRNQDVEWRRSPRGEPPTSGRGAECSIWTKLSINFAGKYEKCFFFRIREETFRDSRNSRLSWWFQVPTFAYEKRLSRIETLRLAITYIAFMGELLGIEPSSPKPEYIPREYYLPNWMTSLSAKEMPMQES